MSLITPYEAIQYSGAGRDYVTRDFCNLIPQIEQEFARECLGKDLWAYLLDDVAAYPDTVTDWKSTVTYSIDDAVIRDGCTFISLVNSNTSDPLTDAVKWELYQKFDNADNNTLWTLYLRRILALKVFISSLTGVTFRAGAGGLVINAGDQSGFRTGKKEEISDLKTALMAEAERVTKNMQEWLADNYVTAGMPTPLSCNDCDSRATRRRRWGFGDGYAGKGHGGGTVIVGGTAAIPRDTFASLKFFDSDEEALAGGLVVGDSYRIKTTAGNPYGKKAGEVVMVEAI